MEENLDEKPPPLCYRKGSDWLSGADRWPVGGVYRYENRRRGLDASHLWPRAVGLSRLGVLETLCVVAGRS